MFGTLNRCEFIGRLGADPESRRTQGDEQVVNFRIAVSEVWKDKNTGEKKEKTEWVTIVIWHQHFAKAAMTWLKKGSRVYVSGTWRTRKWQDQNGNDRYSTECVLTNFSGDLQILDNRLEKDEGTPSQQIAQASHQRPIDSAQSHAGQSGGLSRELDDEIPF